MSHNTVYLELAADGRCLAHLPNLPGCVVRAPSRAEAPEQLPAAVDAHLAWLRRHGEPVPPIGEPFTFEIAGEYPDGGPFDAGDTAALLPPDREPLAPGEMKGYFRLMAHTRADLLALTQGLPDDLLDWSPTPESFSIRRILRHVGNAEEWYVSRLVPPDSLPPEWEDDEHLPLFDFLAMERRTAIARLRQLTEAERSQVAYPTAWTRNPDEPWTTRKALRRFLEHELEHTAQVREVLAAYHAQKTSRNLDRKG